MDEMSHKVKWGLSEPSQPDFQCSCSRDPQSSKPGRWHNGSAYVVCPGDCPFKSKPSFTSADACREVTGCIPPRDWHV